MLGMRKLATGAAAVAVVAAGLMTGAPPARAVAENVCTVVTQPAEVSNMMLYNPSTRVNHPHVSDAGPQTQMGSWTTNTGVTVARFGLYYPATDPVRTHAVPRQDNFGGTGNIPHTPLQTGDRFHFAQTGTCNNNGAKFNTYGEGIGYCGRSVGLGTGTVTLNGVRTSTIIRWESTASQLYLLDPSSRGSVNAQPTPTDPSKGSCLSGTAITFLVDGALADVRPLP